MRATPLLILAALAATAVACNKQPQAQNEDIAITNVPAGANVELLPPDESSATPSNQLINGADNPDVNYSTSNSD